MTACHIPLISGAGRGGAVGISAYPHRGLRETISIGTNIQCPGCRNWLTARSSIPLFIFDAHACGNCLHSS